MGKEKYSIGFIFIMLCLCPFMAKTQEDKAVRQEYLKELILLQEKPSSHDSFVSFHDLSWEDWIKRTGELPPNYGIIPSIPFLPEPLIIGEGKENEKITTMAQWETQREYFKEQVKHILSGTFPDPPTNLKAEILSERTENGVRIQMIELRFGENHKAKLTLEVFTPPGEGPFPVFMTQWNHRGWTQIAVRRGYMGLIYAGADAKDDTREYLELYPDYDWSTLMARAWGAHRAVDYLYTLEEVDKSKIAITGHSRNGKQSLFAAAFDERITATITSSGGTGGEFPYRYTDERHSNESIDYLVSRRTHWLHPRLRFYSGREHKMPIDQNSLMALIAPNALMLSSSIREGGGGDPWAIEQIYTSLTNVYDFLGEPEKLGIRLRDGQHAVAERDIEAYRDWLDIQFGRKNLPWENQLFYNYSFEKWKRENGESIELSKFPKQPGQNIPANVSDLEKTQEKIKEDLIWLLGDEPAGLPASDIETLSQKEDYVSSFMPRPRVKNGQKLNITPYNAMGDYLYGSLYFPTDEAGERITGAMPVLIFLHKYTNTGYDSELNALIDGLLAKGIAVLTYDMIGYGARIEEGTLFYQRYPHWSKMGKMVTDARAAVDALESLDFIDKDKIFVGGYALGGTVGLITAALEPRIAGLALSSAFTPLRNASGNVEGLKAYSHLYGLIPRLGLFDGEEYRIPVDFPEMLANIAPRPVMVISPELDRHADHENVITTMEGLKQLYQKLEVGDALEWQSPHAFNHFTEAQQQEMIKWLVQEVAK
mgnify:FL=1